MASLEGEVSLHWQHEKYLGHAKFVAETAVKTDKDMKKKPKKTNSQLLVWGFFRCNTKPSFKPQS